MKSFIKNWVLPPGMRYILSSWVYSLIRGRNFSTVKDLCRKSDRLYVLATGPSLTRDIEKYNKKIRNTDVAVMNQFAESSLFQEIKPRLYFLVDGLYFKREKELGSTVGEKVYRVRNILLNRVDWPMILICPDFSKNSELIRIISKNKFINFIYYNSRADPGGNVGLWLMKRRLVSPPAQTVTSVALGVGVIAKYHEVYLLGADSSLHMMMNVDQKTNEMYLGNEHFYGTKKEKSFCDAGEKKPVSVGYWLSCVSKMFLGYERVRELADYCGVRVVNATSFSWIDSLERENEDCN